MVDVTDKIEFQTEINRLNDAIAKLTGSIADCNQRITDLPSTSLTQEEKTSILAVIEVLKKKLLS